MRVLKLGSCWGGWDCSNPSYLAPAHYRVFKDYMQAFAHLYATSPQAMRRAEACAGLEARG